MLRRRGWLLAATWGKQLDTAADAVIAEEVDAAAAPPGPDLLRSDGLTDSADKMRALLEPAGFTDVTTTAQLLDAQFDAASSLSLRTESGILGWRYHRLDRRAQEELRGRGPARLATLSPADFLNRSEVLLTTARRV